MDVSSIEVGSVLLRSGEKITQTVADICKFVMDSCVHVGRTFFNKEGELATAEKYERLRNWSNMLRVPDYMLPDFGVGKEKKQ